MPAYNIFFRETMVNRFSVRIDDVANVREAIEKARRDYADLHCDLRLDETCELEDLAIFAADELKPGTRVSAERSWELKDVSGDVDVPFEIEL